MRMVAISLALVLGASACSADSSSTAGSPSTSSTITAASTTTTTAPPETTGPPTTVPPTTVPPTTAAPPDTIPDIELPGESFDVAPQRGAVLSVLGVRHDDVLNVRVWPGTDGRIVATLAPTADDFSATGRSRLLPNSVWWEIVTVHGVVGWVSSSFTAVMGVTNDVTSQIVEETGDTVGDSIEAVGLAMAQIRAQGEATQRIEMVVAPTEGDLGEVTFDVVGLGDDAVAGVRLHIFVAEEAGDGTWTLRTVESTAMCQSHRGGSPGDPCP